MILKIRYKILGHIYKWSWKKVTGFMPMSSKTVNLSVTIFLHKILYRFFSWSICFYSWSLLCFHWWSNVSFSVLYLLLDVSLLCRELEKPCKDTVFSGRETVCSLMIVPPIDFYIVTISLIPPYQIRGLKKQKPRNTLLGNAEEF